MQDLLIKDGKALKAIMIAGMIWKRMNKQLGMKWKPSLPENLRMDLWMYLFVDCRMEPSEADDWIDQRLTRWWRQLIWLSPLPMLAALVLACPLGLLLWLGAPMLLLAPLYLGMILLWIAVFVYRVFFFTNGIQQYFDGKNWIWLLKKCRGAFPLRRISWACVPMAAIVTAGLLLIR